MGDCQRKSVCIKLIRFIKEYISLIRYKYRQVDKYVNLKKVVILAFQMKLSIIIHDWYQFLSSSSII